MDDMHTVCYHIVFHLIDMIALFIFSADNVHYVK